MQAPIVPNVDASAVDASAVDASAVEASAVDASATAPRRGRVHPLVMELGSGDWSIGSCSDVEETSSSVLVVVRTFSPIFSRSLAFLTWVSWGVALSGQSVGTWGRRRGKKIFAFLPFR